MLSSGILKDLLIICLLYLYDFVCVFSMILLHTWCRINIYQQPVLKHVGCLFGTPPQEYSFWMSYSQILDSVLRSCSGISVKISIITQSSILVYDSIYEDSFLNLYCVSVVVLRNKYDVVKGWYKLGNLCADLKVS